MSVSRSRIFRYILTGPREYPGAPDRGGKERDIKNFVSLMKTLRETFDDSPRGGYGLTFTIPSSYWSVFQGGGLVAGKRLTVLQVHAVFRCPGAAEVCGLDEYHVIRLTRYCSLVFEG